LLARALNRNQYLILGYVAQNHYKCITEVLQGISEKEGIALSTLKVNSRILRGLELVEFSDVAVLTDFGVRILSLLGGGDSNG
jgi:molybdenum cofactor biosynthesis enzyme MoaA